MSLTICTGMWGPRREEYARIFLEAFERFWPAGVGLVIYTDGPIAAPSRAEVRRISSCAGYSDFIARHGGDPIKEGRTPAPGAKWKPGALERGYNFRFDLVRFAGQGFIPEHAAAGLHDGDVLVWLDADVAAFKPVPADFVERLIGSHDGAFLGREPKHSEIGFWAVRLGEETRALIGEFAEFYRSDDVLRLKEWHSAFVWDAARRLVHDQLGLNMRNLTPGGSGHVWFQSPLREYLDHLKGDRKAAGRSRERRA